MIEIDPLLVKQVVQRGKRIDGRPMDKYRDIVIEPGCIPYAEGSARVRLGDTEVVAGIKVEPGTPFSDTPDEGVMMVGVEFVPLASPSFEAGPPSEEAVEVARVVDRAIRESKVIDFKKLCIKAGEKVWMVFVDIDVMDDGGNLIDACSLAALSALTHAKVPALDEEGKVKQGEYSGKLPIDGKPLCTTFVKIGDEIMADPSLPETHALEARLTVGTFEKDGHVKLCSMQKGGAVGFTFEELETMIHMAEEKGKELRKLIH
jgi:exosome complex component RRP42